MSGELDEKKKKLRMSIKIRAVETTEPEKSVVEHCLAKRIRVGLCLDKNYNCSGFINTIMNC